jgi:hypothetical protein
MIKYDWSASIARPPAEVFDYLVDTKKQALWSDVPMRQITPGNLAKGSKMEVTFGSGLLKAVIGLEMTDVVDGERMAFETYSGPIKWTGAYTLRPADAGTDLNYAGSLTFTGLWRLLEPFIGREMKAEGIKEFEKLKAVVEAG